MTVTICLAVGLGVVYLGAVAAAVLFGHQPAPGQHRGGRR